MTQRITISNIEGPFSVDVQVWEQQLAETYDMDGNLEQVAVTVEEQVLSPGQCFTVTLWGGRGVTITELV